MTASTRARLSDAGLPYGRAPVITALITPPKLANDGTHRPCCFPASSQRRRRTAAAACGVASNSRMAPGDNGPPCTAKLRQEAVESVAA